MSTDASQAQLEQIPPDLIEHNPENRVAACAAARN